MAFYTELIMLLEMSTQTITKSKEKKIEPVTYDYSQEVSEKKITNISKQVVYTALTIGAIFLFETVLGTFS